MSCLIRTTHISHLNAQQVTLNPLNPHPPGPIPLKAQHRITDARQLTDTYLDPHGWAQ